MAIITDRYNEFLDYVKKLEAELRETIHSNEYFELTSYGAIVDGTFTPEELRLVADAQDKFNTKQRELLPDEAEA